MPLNIFYKETSRITWVRANENRPWGATSWLNHFVVKIALLRIC